MDDIHTPSVVSGPTSSHSVAHGVDHEKLSLMDLVTEKQRVEGELSALSNVLDSVSFLSPFGSGQSRN